CGRSSATRSSAPRCRCSGRRNRSRPNPRPSQRHRNRSPRRRDPMAAAFTFQYEVTADLISQGAETALAELRAGRPPERIRSVAIAEGIVCAQLLAILIVSIVFDFPGWLTWSAAIALAVFGLWTGSIVFVLVMYPWNRARFEQQIAEGYRNLDS